MMTHRPMTPERSALAIQQHLRGGGVVEPAGTLAALHDRQRHAAEPPRPWTIGIAKRRAASGLPPIMERRSTSEPPRPYAIAIAKRASEGR